MIRPAEVRARGATLSRDRMVTLNGRVDLNNAGPHGPVQLERGERVRQQVTIGVCGVLFVVAVVFLYASGLLDGRRIETLECGGSVALPDGSIWVLTCDEGGAP